MVDNFDEIRPLLNFEEGFFYHIQILRRKKENPEASHVKFIKEFFVNNKDYLNKIEDTMKGMCDYFNARSYIRLNRRSYKKIALKSISRIADLISNEQYESVPYAYTKAAGQTHSEEPKRWIVDIDTRDYTAVEELEQVIKDLQKDIQKDYRVEKILETPNGYHLITNPFNVKEFRRFYPIIDIHKENPTIMYSP